MLIYAVLGLIFLLTKVDSICSSGQYWNPLNNACVNGKFYVISEECPWNAPNLYYADATTNSCVLTCPTTPSRYANDLTQTCVESTYNFIQFVPGMLQV